jgi:hypothetical protein
MASIFELFRKTLLNWAGSVQDARIITGANVLPWKGTADEVACNFALGHLVENVQRRAAVAGRIHAETYVSAVGAIAGYAAQRTLFAGNPGVSLNRATTVSGEQYWFGDALNDMLVPKTNAEANRCVWSLASGGALAAGLRPQQLPNFGAMSGHVASTIGGESEGRSSVPAVHQAHLPARKLLLTVWPTAIMCLTGKFPGANASRVYGEAPVAWWSAIAAQASNRPIIDVKSVLSPDIALTLLMESAIYCSKLDRSTIESA